MATIGSLKKTTTFHKAKSVNLSRYLPFLDWLVHYRRHNLVGDLMAGLIVALGTGLVWALSLDEMAGVAIVGDVPAGLPSLSLPVFDLHLWELLLPTALAISFVGYMESISVATFKHVWRYNKADAASLLITFLAVLTVGVETGIVVGVIATILLFLWRTNRPHVAIVGRVGNTETYRNVHRHQVKTCPHVIALRIDESLYFANTKFLEDKVLCAIADRPEVKHLVLIGIAVNFIDASALETLGSLIDELRDAGVQLYLAEIKGPVMDRLKAIGFVEKIRADHIYLSTHEAMKALDCR